MATYPSMQTQKDMIQPSEMAPATNNSPAELLPFNWDKMAISKLSPIKAVHGQPQLLPFLELDQYAGDRSPLFDVDCGTGGPYFFDGGLGEPGYWQDGTNAHYEGIGYMGAGKHCKVISERMGLSVPNFSGKSRF